MNYVQWLISMGAITGVSFGIGQSIEAETVEESSFGMIVEHYDWTREGILARGTVSLRDFAWAEDLDWVRDFEYQSLLHTKEGRIETVPRYTIEMVSNYVAGLKESPWVQPSSKADADMVLGQTRGWDEEEDGSIANWRYDDYGSPDVPPQDIFGFTVTDPESDPEEGKLQVVLISGNHSSEMHGNWALHGFVDFLLSDDPRAEVLRQRAAFHIYPLACPESRYHQQRIPTMPSLAGLPVPDSRVMEHYPLRGGPELHAVDDDGSFWEARGAMGGMPDHNRVWDTSGKFVTVDTIVPAMVADTGGNADYIWDFHGGYPHNPGDYRGTSTSRDTPYARTLRKKDWPYSGVRHHQSSSRDGMVRGKLAYETLNAKGAFTFEPGGQLTKPEVLTAGKTLALGFYKAYFVE